MQLETKSKIAPFVFSICWIFSASALANAPTSTLREAEKKLEAFDRLESAVYDTQLPACPEDLTEEHSFVFAFSGANDLCPSYQLYSVPNADLDGLNADDFLYALRHASLDPEEFGAANLNAFRSRIDRSRKRIELRKQADAAKHTCNFSSFLGESMETAFQESLGRSAPSSFGNRILYYDWSQVGEARTCAKSLDSLAAKANRTLSVSIIGHSLGGTAAAEFYEGLEPYRNLVIRRILTLDPVERNPKLVGSLLGFPTRRKVSTETPFGKWWNVFQRTDTDSLGDVMGIRGIQLQGSSRRIRNTLLTPTQILGTEYTVVLREGESYTEQEQRIRYAHTALLKHEGIQSAYRNLLRINAGLPPKEP